MHDSVLSLGRREQYAHTPADLELVAAAWMQKAEPRRKTGCHRSVWIQWMLAWIRRKNKLKNLNNKMRSNRKCWISYKRNKWTYKVARKEKLTVQMRNLFREYFQTLKHERHEVLQLMGSTLRVRSEEKGQLFTWEQRSVTRWTARWLGSESVPHTALRPMQPSVHKRSFSELFVEYLETESHSAFSTEHSACNMKPVVSSGRKKTS